MPGVIPDAVDGAPLPLPGICRVVNPRIPERPFRTNLPVSAAALHTITTSLLSSSMLLRKHATCRRRLQVPNRIRRKNAKKACPLSHTIGSHDAPACVPVRVPVGGSGFFEQPGREDVRPDLRRDPGGRYLNTVPRNRGLVGALRAACIAHARAPVPSGPWASREDDIGREYILERCRLRHVLRRL